MKSANRLRTVDLAYMGLFAALMAICAWISVPMPAPLVPFTLQTFAIFAAVNTLGGRRGTYAVGIYLLLGLVMILDGGLGLVKISLKRFLKISILKNTRTPLHDHARKNMGWSDPQTVYRFAIIQAIICFAAISLSM